MGQQPLHGSELAEGRGSLSGLADAEEEEGQELEDVVQDRVDAVLLVFDGRFARDGVGIDVVFASASAAVPVSLLAGRAVAVAIRGFRGRSDFVQARDCSGTGELTQEAVQDATGCGERYSSVCGSRTIRGDSRRVYPVS